MPILAAGAFAPMGHDGSRRARRTLVFAAHGLARHMRDGLPRASFIGFTGTPIEPKDANTRAVFGDYIDIYDIKQAVDAEDLTGSANRPVADRGCSGNPPCCG